MRRTISEYKTSLSEGTISVSQGQVSGGWFGQRRRPHRRNRKAPSCSCPWNSPPNPKVAKDQVEAVCNSDEASCAHRRRPTPTRRRVIIGCRLRQMRAAIVGSYTWSSSPALACLPVQVCDAGSQLSNCCLCSVLNARSSETRLALHCSVRHSFFQ